MIELDGLAVREERWAAFWPDAQELIAEHSAEIGPRDGVPLQVNTALFEKLDEVGALQTATARSNGRMFGYLLTILCPSLENPAFRVATQTAFFVSKDARGAGWKLLKESVGMLQAKGVHEVQMRAGVRGSGPRLGVLYRRLGAVDHGQLYSLMLGSP